VELVHRSAPSKGRACAGTPGRPEGRPDPEYLRAVARRVAGTLSQRNSDR